MKDSNNCTCGVCLWIERFERCKLSPLCMDKNRWKLNHEKIDWVEVTKIRGRESDDACTSIKDFFSVASFLLCWCHMLLHIRTSNFSRKRNITHWIALNSGKSIWLIKLWQNYARIYFTNAVRDFIRTTSHDNSSWYVLITS